MPSRAEKQRRSQLRKAAGLKRFSELYAESAIRRTNADPSFARRSTFLIAHACFNCRKSFKRRPDPTTEVQPCPQCGGPAMQMGRGFKAPRKGEAEQWKKVRKLYEAGYRFHQNGMRDVPPYPDRLRDVDQFIADYPDHPFRIWELRRARTRR